MVRVLPELVVLPDLYRLNRAQQKACLSLHELGLVESPVFVERVSRGRAKVTDKAGRVHLIDEDGSALHVPNTEEAA